MVDYKRMTFSRIMRVGEKAKKTELSDSAKNVLLKFM